MPAFRYWLSVRARVHFQSIQKNVYVYQFREIGGQEGHLWPILLLFHDKTQTEPKTLIGKSNREEDVVSMFACLYVRN